MYPTSTPQSKVAEVQLVSDILSDNAREVNKALSKIYKTCYHPIMHFVVKNNGDTHDAKDLFQEAMIAFYQSVKCGRFRGESAIKTYLFAIAKNRWFSKQNKRQITEELDNVILYEGAYDPLEEQEERSIDEYKAGMIRDGIKRLDRKDRRFINDYYFKEMTHEKIAAKYKFGSAQVSKNKKCRALRELKNAFMKVGRDHGLVGLCDGIPPIIGQRSDRSCVVSPQERKSA